MEKEKNIRLSIMITVIIIPPRAHPSIETPHCRQKTLVVLFLAHQIAWPTFFYLAQRVLPLLRTLCPLQVLKCPIYRSPKFRGDRSGSPCSRRVLHMPWPESKHSVILPKPRKAQILMLDSSMRKGYL